MSAAQAPDDEETTFFRVAGVDVAPIKAGTGDGNVCSGCQQETTVTRQVVIGWAFHQLCATCAAELKRQAAIYL